MTLRPGDQQRGVALITALLIAALVTVVATAMASRQQLDIRRTGNLLEADQAFHYALAAETWAGQILKQDKKDSAIDTLAEDWANKLPPVPVEGGSIGGSIEDLQGRFNLNNLRDAAGKSDPVRIKAFQSLLAQVSLAKEKIDLSPSIANRVADWLDDDLNSAADGAEDLEYLNLSLPYRTPNQPMASPSELAAIQGLSATDVAALLPLVSTLPQATRVNINTAPEMVLMALHGKMDPRIVSELAAYRKEQPFETAAAFVAKLRGDYDIVIDDKLIDVKSDYFLVTIDATIGRTQLRMYSLLMRNNDKITTINRSIGSY
jgi:general secretion pathway protein K